MKRDIAVCIILSLVTCGIYWLYWEYQLNRDIAAMNGRVPDVDGPLFIILMIFTCGIYNIIWNYRMGQMIDESRSARGQANNNYGILFLVLSLLQVGSIVNDALMQIEVNNVSVC